jgi:hypothetical protein
VVFFILQKVKYYLRELVVGDVKEPPV